MRLKWITLLIVSMLVIGFCCNRHAEKVQMEYEIATVTDTVYVDSLRTMPVDTVVVE
jgi:hypothetical protein